ncbi:MAG TPA: pyridoxamine 5'-phosphate oxidase family protein [Chitinophagaceae bacterium]|nr:pyridoxamine 5'-phosphate oxidase family protein [Chitinophagaceae bacterium]
MLTANDLDFLRERIDELRSALFFNTSNAVLKLPTCIISTLQMDEAGQVWFFVNRPEQYLHEFDREFPARLDFFRKGKRFFLHLTGKAYIISDPEELNELINVTDDVKQKAMSHMVLIKFKIATANYYERPVPGKSIVQKVRMQLSRLLFREKYSYKPYLEPTY